MSTKSGCRRSRSENGFILVSVILSVTLLLSAATAFAWFARIQVKRVETRIFIVQARSAAEIVCSLAAKKIAADKQEFEQAQFDGVPVFVINGTVLSGAQPPQKFIEVIDAALKK